MASPYPPGADSPSFIYLPDHCPDHPIPFRLETRHKKSLLPKKAAGRYFEKASLPPAKVNSSFFNKQLCFFGSPAVHSRNTRHR
jgi:hypothetical protein